MTRSKKIAALGWENCAQLESLSPLKELAPGQSVGHTETWQLFPIETQPDRPDEAALAGWFAPYFSKIGTL